MTPAQPVTTFWRLAGMSYLQVRKRFNVVDASRSRMRWATDRNESIETNPS
jgi:hypothetical protein